MALTAEDAAYVPDLYSLDRSGVLNITFHEGQLRAWRSNRRFILVVAGTQSGKTSFGPFWFEREMQRGGPGDYLIVTPDFPLLEAKLLPEFRRLFEEVKMYGKYLASPRRRFFLSADGEHKLWGERQPQKTTVVFGYASDPQSLESMTAKAAWLDEPGQAKFKLGSWYAILRRLSLAQGRVLLTTTPYNLGWVYQKLYLPWQQGDKNIQVVNFESRMNPRFPIAEWERAQRDLPKWLFDQMYKGLFTAPAGLIYDSFDRTKHVIPPFEIPDHWRRYWGIDFGGINTVAVFYAAEPQTGRLFLYRSYHAGKRTAQTHVASMLLGEKRMPDAVWGGSKSEDNWRIEFRNAGLPVQEPDQPDVEIGIQRVYGAHARDEILVFDNQEAYLDQKQTYSRPVGPNGEVLPGIEDQHSFHYLDAERYVISPLKSATQGMVAASRSQIVQRNAYDDDADGRFAQLYG